MRMPALGMFVRLVFFATRVMIGSLPVMMRCRIVMSGRGVMRFRPRLAAFAAYFLVERAIVRPCRRLSTRLAGLRMLFLCTTLISHDYLSVTPR